MNKAFMAKWTTIEVELLKTLFNNKLSNDAIAKELGKSAKAVRLYLNRKLDLYFSDNNDNWEEIACLNCSVKVTVLKSQSRHFCSSACAATHNNANRILVRRQDNYGSSNVGEVVNRKRECLHCGEETRNLKYCSYKCTTASRIAKADIAFLSGKTLTEKAIRSFLIRKHGAKCTLCGWSEYNPFTKTIPIEMHHIDGNSDNNSEGNLILLCPNHHALQPTHKGANTGAGRRVKRRERYAAGKSF